MRNLFVALVFVTRLAGAEFYQPQLLETQWRLQSGKLFCSLSQEIPHLGQAGLEQEAGEPLKFVLRLTHRSQVTTASIRIDPAPWQHQVLIERSFPVSMRGDDGGPRLLEVRGEIAERMLTALYAGHFPCFTLQRPWRDGMSEARVGVSSVRFREKYDDFQRCRMQLPPFGPRDFEGLRFYFSEGQVRLPEELSGMLPKIARYLKLTGKGQVVVRNATAGLAFHEGHSWFQKRFSTLRKRLQALGLQAVQISTRPATGKSRIEMTLFGPEGLRLYHYGRHQRTLNAAQKRRLTLLANYVRDFFPGKLVIHGHTDGARWRSEKTNRALAGRWARAVRDFLAGQGVDADRMRIQVWGSRRKVASNLSRAGQAKNRRVVIELVDDPGLTAAGN